MYRDFWQAGLRVFPLYGFQGNGKDAICHCENLGCQAAGKHPRASNWQHTPEWDEDQIGAMADAGHFASGYGVLCAGLIVIDIDARNGGLDSYAKLIEAVPGIAGAGMVVNTGSGGGSRHLYFAAPADPAAMVQHLPDYPGIDFKSSGYVVGPGSHHASGGEYTLATGGPDDIDQAPPGLIDLLRKPDRYRADYDGRAVDVSHGDLAEMVDPIDPDCAYETWIRIGMAIHHATGGTGYDIWDQWSARGDKYDAAQMGVHWHSFGRCTNPVTLGTLVHYAEAAGWKMPVTFTPEQGDIIFEEAPDILQSTRPFAGETSDLTRPPGMTGDVAQWIEDLNRRVRKRLSVAGALVSLGNLYGLRYTDDKDEVTTNLFAFCVAGARTGKDAIIKGVTQVHRAAGLSAATHGAIKSEQEIIRNLTRHQAAFYAVDEVGIMLRKIKNAQEKGGAAYLDGVIGMLMSAYSKGNDYLLLTGDAKDHRAGELAKEAEQLNKRADGGDTSPYIARRLAEIETSLASIENGLERPFLSLIGFTTPSTFDDLVDYQAATNGFIGRSLLFHERETVPPRKRRFKARNMPDEMAATLRFLANGGEYDVTKDGGRIEHYGPKIVIPTEPRAVDALEHVADWLDDEAREHKGKTGLEALYLGAYELVSKVSLILAVPEGRRNWHHVRWAFHLIVRDLDEKSRLVVANDSAKDNPKRSLRASIANVIDGDDDGETIAVIKNRLRRFKESDIRAALDEMVQAGVATKTDGKHPGNGRPFTKYRLSA